MLNGLLIIAMHPVTRASATKSGFGKLSGKISNNLPFMKTLAVDIGPMSTCLTREF